MGLRRYVMKFGFDGTRFEGYARQPERTTVEGELLATLLDAAVIDHPKGCNFRSAARLDRGVSAVGAAVAFDSTSPTERIMDAVNALAPPTLVAYSIALAPPGLDPRRAAVGRWYRYHFPEKGLEAGLDLASMCSAARHFEGEHDFSAFARLDGRNPRRRITDISLERRPGAIVMDVRGESFLWNQVRRMAGALLAVGMGVASPMDIGVALEGGGVTTFPTEPPEGLFLMDVEFRELDFGSFHGLPTGAKNRVLQDHHRRRCGVRFYDYLRERIGL